jgi:iron(III) transport system ATP-binding protein
MSAGTTSDRESPALDVRGLRKSFATTLAVDGVDLAIARGSLVALLGPSGCGKTTLLRMVAGLETPDAGTIDVAGIRVFGPEGSIPPERRAVGMVFQAYALFPHLDVAANVAYGLGAMTGPERAARVGQVLELVGLADLGGRMPDALSGGQQQRVALARALAPSPSLLLLDEPFSSLDASLRASVRDEVRSILRAAGQTALLVTHDQEEALSFTDVVGVMFDGALHQLADPQTLYRSPASPEVAGFVGEADLLAGRRAGQFLVDTAIGRLATDRAVATEQVRVVVRPESVRLRRASDGAARVAHVAYFGHDQLIAVTLADGTDVRARGGPELDLHRDDRVSVQVEGRVVTFPA